MSETGEQQQADAAQIVVDLGTFLKYLRRVVPAVLEDEDDASKALETALDDLANHECIKKFLSDAQVYSLLVQKSTNKGIADSAVGFQFLSIGIRFRIGLVTGTCRLTQIDSMFLFFLRAVGVYTK